VFHFGLQILAMRRSYESILDHSADYLRFLSNAQLYWFTLNTSYDHGCHLINQFSLGPKDYKVLLIVANRALHTYLRQRDERQCNNHPDKRHERVVMLIILVGSGGAMAQLAVSAPQWLGWQRQQQWWQQK
jgi:hypothetical protein